MTATDTTTMSTAQIEAERLRRKREVALGYRIFASLRWGDLGDGHITARDPEHTDCMWLLRYPVGFERATIDDLVLVRADGTTLDGRQINNTAHHIHHPIHAANPNVIGVAHTHTPWGTPFCASGRGLEPITQEACQFYERWAFFDDEEVQVQSVEAGQRIADALGPNRAIILRNHGLLSVGDSVAEAVGGFVMMERVAESHMKVRNPKPISAEAARFARDDLVKLGIGRSAFATMTRRHIGDPNIVVE
jgi:ribulose-5-phosphate 4-epimerase/fuculose-1-phosphate aldolase